MTTYFPGSKTETDSAKMLYLKESLPSSYSETPVIPGSMMMYTNFAPSSEPYSGSMAANSQQPSSVNDNASQQEIVSQIGLNNFSAWKNSSNEMMLMQPTGEPSDVFLSLGTHVTPGFQMPSIQYRDNPMGFSSVLGANQLFPDAGSGGNGPGNPECMHPGFPGSNSEAKMNISSYGMSSIGRVISNSKYLKAAEQMLDETVNVKLALKERKSQKELDTDPGKLGGGSKYGSSESTNEQNSSNNVLSVAEKQDLQNMLSKLLSMLDEVHHKYKRYYQHMQIVVSSFDMVAGSGAAKPYTALALQTISCHFRSLRDAINGQICITRKGLGEQDASSNNKGISISRLRYVDRQLRQQRALQQLGMMQQHAWRPQRGLPETAVSILRAWLFEHFLHPYPKDSDKIMLARQTGLTRSQVSNWFINARVRLWKPMVEEMYKEEIGDAEMDSTSSAEVPKATKSDAKVPEDRGEDAHHTATSTALENLTTGMFFDSKFDHKSTPEIVQNIGHADIRNTYPQEEVQVDRQAGIGSTSLWAEEGKSIDDRRPIVDESTIFSDTIGHFNGRNDRFMAVASAAYHMSELEILGNGGVSLTLGLQHSEGGSLAMPVAEHHSFGSMREDTVCNAAPSSTGLETAEFDCIDSGNRQLKFGTSQILHDFVA